MINIKHQSLISKIADVLMIPVMYFLQWNIREAPQQTHFWNNQKLVVSEVEDINPKLLVTVAGNPRAIRRWFGPIPVFHMPIFGGWKNFIVLEPVQTVSSHWHVGWIASDVIGLSQIKLKGPVRLLTNPGSVQFFGVLKDGTQVELHTVGHGSMGQAGKYAKVPLL